MLQEAGYEFQVVPPRDGAEPDTIEGLSPHELVAELARRKGLDVVAQLSEKQDIANWIVLAADTVAVCEDQVLGKPRDVTHAGEILRLMSGRTHQVLTGVYMDSLRGAVPSVEVVKTELQMSPLTDAWLENYLSSGRWRGKAGAFGYQDGLDFVQIIEGSDSNVVGLPMERTAELLAGCDCFPKAPHQS